MSSDDWLIAIALIALVIVASIWWTNQFPDKYRVVPTVIAEGKK